MASELIKSAMKDAAEEISTCKEFHIEIALNLIDKLSQRTYLEVVSGNTRALEADLEKLLARALEGESIEDC